jgi:hypothetical protein
MQAIHVVAFDAGLHLCRFLAVEARRADASSRTFGLPRLDKECCHCAGEVNSKPRVARLDAHGVGPWASPIRLRMVPKLSTMDVQAPKIRRKASSVALLGAV